MTRKLEVIISIVVGIVSLIFLGGYALTMTQMSQGQFEETLFQSLGDTVTSKGPELAYVELKTLGVWFGATLVLTLFGLVISSYLIGNNRKPKLAGIGYLITGIILLLGSQTIAFPLAFFCFVLAGLAFFRKKDSHIRNTLKNA